MLILLFNCTRILLYAKVLIVTETEKTISFVVIIFVISAILIGGAGSLPPWLRLCLKLTIKSIGQRNQHKNSRVLFCMKNLSQKLDLTLLKVYIISILFHKQIMLESGFIEEMRTTLGNKEAIQTFFHNSPYSQKYDLIRLTMYHWQPCLQFCGIIKCRFCKISRELKNATTNW